MKQNIPWLAMALVIFGVATRLAPHPVNFTALGALALWSTTLFRSRAWAFGVPLAVLLVSDLILGFHSTMIWVYGAFALIALISLWLEPRQSWLRAGAGSLLASLLFFALTNFGVWAAGELYPPTAEGLAQSYMMALPFLKNQVLGDLLYTGVLGFAVKALADRREAAAVRSR